MNNEIKEILDFKEDADYKRLSVDEITILRDCITNLQEENERLRNQLQQKENIIKEVRKYVNKVGWTKQVEDEYLYTLDMDFYKNVLEILDKAEEK